MADWAELLTDLVRVRGAALYRYGFLLCGNREEAADLVQESLVRTFSRPVRDWDRGSVEGYVRQAMLNHYLDQRRRRGRWSLLAGRLTGTEVMADPAAGVVDRADLLQALGCLSPRQRACVVLRYYEDHAVAQIAADLGCSAGTVKRHLSDALARLENALRPSPGGSAEAGEAGPAGGDSTVPAGSRSAASVPRGVSFVHGPEDEEIGR